MSENNMAQQGFAGNRGEEIRSDCYVEIQLTKRGGIRIDLQSRVAAIYGETIEKLCKTVLKFFGVKNANIYIEDSGALDFVIAARIEAALKQCLPTQQDYLLPVIPENRYGSSHDRFRRTRLYLPGNSPRLMLNAGIHQPDAIILDLEDSVAPAKKSEARILVRNALCQLNFYNTERMVRINQLPAGLDDLQSVVPFNTHVILIPKCEEPQQIVQVDQKISKILDEGEKEAPVFLMPIIESAKGVINAHSIAAASPNVVALAIGLEDYAADLGVQRTTQGQESFFARCQVVNAARAAGKQAIDSVFSDVGDLEGLAEAAKVSKSLGFDGLGCIHPRQIKVIHRSFAPSETEIQYAQQVVSAFEDAQEKGLGVVSLGSRMIDPPVVKRAQKTLDLAIELGKISRDWRAYGEK